MARTPGYSVSGGLIPEKFTGGYNSGEDVTLSDELDEAT